MEQPRRKLRPHRVPSWVSDNAIFFITIAALPRGKNTLGHDDRATALFAAILILAISIRF